ncbi:MULTISPECIES: glycosyltransferase [Bacillus cereus group]|uniref:Glycosyl transferase n=3 Tax=Bacillus cereus group TaxID=86661 RepID=A0A9X7BR02_BACTU|nr:MULTISPECIES: glycosyltransferase family 2 protein [Bacillus cereus group]MCQ6285453.1 glycosyltransferase family 2 protein [Bacillus cereus]MCQ6301984.1 glycosyltransferase family 2 protein [Bacillus cereus]MCQ6314181.1 glycosyltransferase family 2 protein [Bacillus cereus]MCQ6343953.1 glycosyltransferase family 2 protein [Bacillus cereus]MCQ6382382.1 glycosyltransferase family 2 protein [Bacillus cereus]
MLSVSIVIPVFNSESIIGQVLNSLIEQDYDKNKYEIILVDDASTDKSVSVIQGFVDNYKNIKLFVNNKNSGRSKTRNKAIENSSNELVIMLDSDCVPITNQFINRHVEFHMSNKKGLGIGAIYFPSKSNNSFDQFREQRENIRLRYGENTTKLEFVYVTTANLSIRMENLRESQGFDEDFKYWGSEDIEFGYRLFKNDYEISLIEQDGDVHHFDERISLKVYCKRIKNLAQYNMPILLEKHPEIINFFGNFKYLEPLKARDTVPKYKKYCIQFLVKNCNFVFKRIIKNEAKFSLKLLFFVYKLYIANFYMEGVQERVLK